MMYRLKNKATRAIHHWRCRGVLKTPPLDIRPVPLTICSMVCRRDLLMYLVAVKSLYRQIGEGRICIINDGTLDQSAIEILNFHLGKPEIVNIGEVPTGPCPRGGTWERLLHIIDLSERSYVIQIDSDIVVKNAIPEVVGLYRANKSFTLGTSKGLSFTSLVEATKAAKRYIAKHVQTAAEQSLDRLPNPDQKRYVRGCSGFAGFAKNAISRAQAEEFSIAMEHLLGERWKQWGSEQVTSNYLIANAPGSEVLPIAKYVNFYPPFEIDGAALVHFIGDHRFEGGIYARESRRFIIG